MRKVSVKFLGIASVGIVLGSIFSLALYMMPKASPTGDKSGNTWNQDKSEKAKEYQQILKDQRDEKLRTSLGVDNIEAYLDDMNLLYDLAKEKDKVEEVEEIMSDYEREQVFYEIFLVTGDSELAEKFKEESELNFKFERVI